MSVRLSVDAKPPDVSGLKAELSELDECIA